MARTRFVGDAGLTVRMTTVMFLLGGLFVALVVALMAIAGGYGGMGFALIVGFIGIGIAIYQWWSSDTVAMKAMRAREVTPQQAPELHAMIDRLCVLADMPKPRVGVADTSMPNAFATGRSPGRSPSSARRARRRRRGWRAHRPARHRAGARVPAGYRPPPRRSGRVPQAHASHAAGWRRASRARPAAPRMRWRHPVRVPSTSRHGPDPIGPGQPGWSTAMRMSRPSSSDPSVFRCGPETK